MNTGGLAWSPFLKSHMHQPVIVCIPAYVCIAPADVHRPLTEANIQKVLSHLTVTITEEKANSVVRQRKDR